VRELSLHILDVVENSLAAEATHITIEIDENLAEDRLTIIVTDDGKGMDRETAARAVDPFFSTRTTRHVGLGLPLFKAAADHCDGQLSVESAPDKGTKVTVQFQHSHIDRAPLGDMVTTLMSILLSDRLVNLSYIHRRGDRSFEFDTEEIRRTLKDIPISHPAVRDWMLDYLTEGEAMLSDVDG